MNVSVIIPFWNGAQWVERAIESVLRQTHAPAEFYVVNDGSRPDEREKLGALAARHGFQILDKGNGGQGTARNHGVRHSRSELICFLDQDDFFLPDHIERLLSLVPADLATFGFAYGSYHLADESGRIHVENDLALNQARLHPPPRDPLELIARNLCILPSASIISRVAFERVGGFDAQFRGYEDDDLFSRMVLAGFDCAYLPEAVYVWCQHKGSTTWSPTMSRSRFLYYCKVRAVHVRDGRVASQEITSALMRRFGLFFYKSAALAADLEADDQLDLTLFQSYMDDLAVDNAPWWGRHVLLARLWLLKHTRTPPLSLLWRLKQFNRRRVTARRVREGRQLL